MVDALASWPPELWAGVSGGGALAIVLLLWQLVRGGRRRAEARLQADLRAGRHTRALDYLLRKGRLVEAAAIEEQRGAVDRAVELLEKAGDVDGAVGVYERAGEWKMAALTLKEAGRLVDAAQVFGRHGRPAQAAELFEESGDLERARAIWEKLGALDRVATIVERTGDAAQAQRLRGEAAERAGQWAAAARLWEESGEEARAVAAWQEAGAPKEAGRLLAAGGDLARAAQLLVEGGDYLGAAPLFARLGKYQEAAEAAYRGGDVPGCINNLEIIGDHLEIARVYTAYGLLREAKAALRGAKPGSKQYRACMDALAAREVRESNRPAALQIYGTLVEASVDAHDIGAHTRRWLVAIAELQLRAGNLDEALAALGRAERLGLMTPELRSRLDALRPALHETMTALRRGDEPSAPSSAVRERMHTLTLPQHPRYEIRGKLGQGGNGIVYHAWDVKLERPLVVKMIANEALPTDMARRWFEREAATSARLNHANIVTVYDVGDIDSQPFIAMELVDGETLRERVGDRLPLSLSELEPVWRQLAAAVHYAHTQGVVHRDIKMDNVMVTTDGVVKLMDFGLAIALNGPDQSVVMAGTPLYMSPEQIRGLDIDQQSDVYALGVLLFKLLTGRYPFEDGNIIEHHRVTPPPDARDYNPAVPAHVARAIQQAMAKAKPDRFGSVRDLVMAMRSG